MACSFKKSRLLLKAALAGSLCVGGASGAFAQEEPASSTPEAAAEETITVTGSRIRGIDPVGSAVISVGPKQLATTGAVTTQDLVNQLPQNAGTGFNEASFSNPFGSATNATRGGAVNLRGVGPQATLLLLNGHRLVPGGTQGAALDPSTLPAKAIARLEVIADGASALYGADAVAGVVNIILRRDLDGVEADGRYGMADNYEQWSTNFAIGKRWSTGQFMVSYEHSWKSALAGTDRAWFRSDNRANGGTDFRATQCNPGTLRFGPTAYPIPGSGPVTPATLVAGAANRCEVTRLADILPSQDRDVVAATFTQELGEWLKFTADGVYLDRRFTAKVVSQGASQTQFARPLPPTNPNFVRPTGAVGTPTLDYSFAQQFGPLGTFGYERNYQITAGFEAQLPAQWSMSLSGTYGHNESGYDSRTINPTVLAQLLGGTHPTLPAFNPFAPISQAQYDAIYTGVFSPRGVNELKMGELRADGPLFDLPAGSVRAAIGGEYYELVNSTAPIQGTVAVPVFNPVRAKRQVKSVYGELFLPILDDPDGNGGKLSASAAVRYDHYSDFGGTTNTKFGLTYEPVSGVSLRASYGTSFRAPLLSDIIEAKGGSLISGAGTRNDVTGPQPVVILVAGNPDIRPEKATTWSLGATFAPEALPGFRVDLNYFNLDYSSQIISLLTDNTVLQRRAIYGALVREFNPALTPAQVQADPAVARLLALGIPVQGGFAAATRFIIDARPYNLGKTQTDGIDFAVSYATDAAGGRLSASVNGAYYFSYKVQQTATAPILDELNHYQYPLRLKARGALNWDNDVLGLGAYLNYANAYTNPVSLTHPRVGSHVTLDLHASVNLPFAPGVSLALDINNLFDRDPPFVDVDGGYDPGQANPLGRFVSVSIRTKF